MLPQAARTAGDVILTLVSDIWWDAKAPAKTAQAGLASDPCHGLLHSMLSQCLYAARAL